MDYYLVSWNFECGLNSILHKHLKNLLLCSLCGHQSLYQLKRSLHKIVLRNLQLLIIQYNKLVDDGDVLDELRAWEEGLLDYLVQLLLHFF